MTGMGKDSIESTGPDPARGEGGVLYDGSPRDCSQRLPEKKDGGYLLSHGCAVPSARAGLTSLFGMGRGGTPPL